MGKVERLSIYLPVALSAALYIFIGYFTERHESSILVTSYVLLFGSYVWLTYNTKPCSITHFILVAIGLRLLLLFAMPNLSDDIYRFVWDGKLLVNSINPFSQLPSWYMQFGTLPTGLTQSLYTQLNSPDYFTIYPPFAQLIFWLSAKASPNSVLGSAVFIRMLIILVEIGTLYFLIKLTDHFGVSRKNVVWYALNPLVILELTGNLHFEAFMIFFLSAGLYYLLKNRVLIASVLVALSISAKLIPLMLLPLFLKRLAWPKLWRFYTFTGLFSLFTFLPLLSSELINGMSSSVSLYFQKFEFNASLYYLIREVGFVVKGYNIIESAGPYLAILLFLSIIFFSLLKHKVKLPNAIMVVLMMYLLLSTTVHPWYVIPVLAFSVLTPYRFVVVWSLLIFLTYMGYSRFGFSEILWVTAIEYIIVIVYMLYEVFNTKKEKQAIACA